MSREEAQSRFSSVKSLFKKEKQVAILIDGPNILRKIGNRQVKVEDVDEIAEKLGSIKRKYIFLNNHAPNKLIEAMVNSGYQPIVVHGDIYVRLGMRALEIAHQERIELILIGSRDARLVPILMKLKDKNIDTAIVGFEPGFSVALKNVADYKFELTE